MTKPMKLVMIEWVDTIGSHDWYHMKNYETRTPGVVRTVGWVLRDLPEYIEVAQSLMDEGRPDDMQVNHTMSIPRPSILSIADIISKPKSIDI
jgi:hypothetical protein